MEPEVKTERFTFYTLGPEFTNLLRGYVAEGRISMVLEVLKDGGMPEEYLFPFIKGIVEFKGDSRVEPGLTIEFCEPEKEWSDHLYWIIRNILSSDFDSARVWKLHWCAKQEDNEDLDIKTKNLKALLQFISVEKILELIWKQALNSAGYEMPDNTLTNHSDGAILRDGTYVICGHQGHNDLYPILYGLDQASAPDWIDDEWTAHVSSNQIVGGIASGVDYAGMGRNQPTEAQLDKLFEMRHQLKMYSSGENMTDKLRKRSIDLHDCGGKYGNLQFLKRFYPEVNTPVITKERPAEPGWSIRTSPEHSLPGLLHSKFDVQDYDAALAEIEADWDKVKEVQKYNTLHYFYQQHVPGANGVCHYYFEAREFTHAVSQKQGDIVNGIIGSQLMIDEQDKIRKIASQLSRDLQQDIQLEFVLREDGEFVVVQLRVLENGPDVRQTHHAPAGKLILHNGATFCKGSGDFDLKDVLIVEQDADSAALLGKKALIVTEDVEFAHVLALSRMLKIPSIYGTGPLHKLKGKRKIHISAYGVNGFICKI